MFYIIKTGRLWSTRKKGAKGRSRWKGRARSARIGCSLSFRNRRPTIAWLRVAATKGKAAIEWSSFVPVSLTTCRVNTNLNECSRNSLILLRSTRITCLTWRWLEKTQKVTTSRRRTIKGGQRKTTMIITRITKWTNRMLRVWFVFVNHIAYDCDCNVTDGQVGLICASLQESSSPFRWGKDSSRSPVVVNNNRIGTGTKLS